VGADEVRQRGEVAGEKGFRRQRAGPRASLDVDGHT
jgi:hypothetical protein